MFASSWLRQLQRRCFPRHAIRHVPVRRVRPRLETLENRLAPATLTVNSTADTANATDTYLSLREAIAIVNSPTLPSGLSSQILGQISGTLHSGGTDTIVFDHTKVTGPITLGGTQLELSLPSTTAKITIDGGAGVTVNANHASRVFEVDGGVAAEIDGLTITGGNAPNDFGGGIDSSGTLTLNDDVITGNTAGTGGGFDATFASLTVNRTTVSNNSAGEAAGVYIQDESAVITNTTISNNTALNTGGLRFETDIPSNSTSLTLENSTISNNTASGNTDSALRLTSHSGQTVTATLLYDTISGNTLASAGGVGGIAIVGDGTVNATLTNTIVSGNTSGGSPADLSGTFDAASANNLIGTGSNLINGQNLNIVGVNNPLLAPLGNYGGPTQTMALLPGSQALDAGTPVSDVTTDERGVARSQSTPDIGAFESPGFNLSVSSGNNQSTTITSAFANPLVVTVAPVHQGDPVAGGQLTFTAPSNGPSAALSSGNPVTIAANGTATVNATANGTFGSYQVTANTAGAVRPAAFSLANQAAKPTLTVSDGGTYNGKPFAATATAVGLDGKTPVFGSFAFTYYVGAGTSGTSLGATAPTNAGTYTVVAAFTSGDPDYVSGGTAQTTFTINPLAVTLSGIRVYDGTTTAAASILTATNLAGSDNVTLSGSTVLASAHAGVETISSLGGLSLGGTSASNYTLTGASGSVTILKATPTVGVSDAGGTYNGSAFPATATVAGVVAGVDNTPSASLEGVTPTVTYYTGDSASGTPLAATPSAPGTYTVVAFFAGSTDYASASSPPLTFTISKATPALTVNDAGGTYNGNPFPASATAVGVDGTTPVNGDFTFTYYTGLGTLGTNLGPTAPSNAGTYTVVAAFTSNDPNYANASAQTSFTINPAAPTLTISDAGGTYNGNPFPATVTIAGVNGQPAASLEGVTPTVTYYAGSGTSGTNLGSTAPTSAGTYTVVASFAGSTDYAAASANTTFTIAQATPTISVTDASGVYNGNSYPATVTIAGVNGQAGSSLEGVTPTLTYYAGSSASGTPLAGAPSAAGTYTVLASFAGSTDYISVTANTTFTIAQATPTISVTDAGGPYTSNPYPAGATAVGVDGTTPVNGGFTFTYYAGNSASGTPLPGAPSAAGTYTVVATFTSSDPNYTNDTAQTTFTISTASTTIAASNVGATFNASQQSVTLTADVSSDAGAVNEGTVTFTVLQGSTVIGTATTSGKVSNGQASVNYVLPGGTAAGSYILDAVYNPGADFAASSDNTHTLTVAPAASSIQFTGVTVVPNLFALTQTETFNVHVSGPGGVVNQGAVTFTVDGQSMSASVDGNSNATVSLTLPLLTAASPQSISAAFSGPNRSSAAATQSVFWNVADLLAPGVATFAADGSQSVQSYLFDLPWLDFLYAPSGQLTEVIFGPNLWSWDISYFGSLALVSLDGVLPFAVIAPTP